MKVSVIIPAYNRKDDLFKCLKSVFKQKFTGFEVIVVDDGSTDGTEQLLEKTGLRRKMIYLKTHRRSGVSKAKNLGIMQAKGKYLWFLDSDTEIPSRDCLAFLFQMMEKHSDIGSLGCEVIKRDREYLIQEHKYFKNSKMHPLGEKITMEPCNYLATCNCFTRSEVVKKIGGFNENYFYGYEDAELGKKLCDLGYQNIIDYRGKVLHFRSISSRAANYSLFFKNRIRFAIWNFPFGQIIKLPFWDVSNFILGLWGNRNLKSDQIKGLSGSFLVANFGRAGLLIKYLAGISYGYLWNLVYLPKTILLKKNQVNFLKPLTSKE